MHVGTLMLPKIGKEPILVRTDQSSRTLRLLRTKPDTKDVTESKMKQEQKLTVIFTSLYLVNDATL